MQQDRIHKKIYVIVVSADKEIIELIKEDNAFQIRGVLDPKSNADALGFPILGMDKDWPKIYAKYPDLKVILAVDHTDRKKRLALHFGIKSLVTLISLDAYISPSATLKQGCLVQHGVKIMSSARIGIACKININAIIHHDTIVGDFCTLAPGSILLGAVKVEDRVFVGAGAIVLPKVHIGCNSVIGAGAVVTKDIPANSVVAGVPARQLIKKVNK